jgi:FixJ family two-component response regulator
MPSAPVFRKLISIVEDNTGVRESLNRLIRSLGYSGATFTTAEEYLLSDLMRDTDCLISDVHLPGMNGADLQARLIADGYRIPIVFLTGLFNETVRARVLEAGAVHYLAKPCDPKTLIGCIEKAVASDVS